MWYILLMAIAGTAGSAACLLALPQSRPQDALLHPAVFAALAVLGILGAAYMVRFPHYYRLVLGHLQGGGSLPGAGQGEGQGLPVPGRAAQGQRPDGGGGFPAHRLPYLQALFFRRHRRMLYKPVKIVLAILAGVTVEGAVALLLLRGEETAATFDLVPRCLPYCVFFLYFMDNNVGTRICKAMFYNCDLAMLKYPWYRREDVVLKNFLLRFTGWAAPCWPCPGRCASCSRCSPCAPGGGPPWGSISSSWPPFCAWGCSSPSTAWACTTCSSPTPPICR